MGLTDRRSERDALDRLIEAVQAGHGHALVVRGDSGVGKTVLLDYLTGQARGCRVARAAGLQSEVELAFAGLHQLCAPMLSRADGLPEPRRAALGVAREMLAAIGVEAFAERARRELIDTGGPARRHGSRTSERLTPQEEQITRLARDGLSNRRSAPSCSSPRARSNGTCARCSPSSASPPGTNCTPRWPGSDRTVSRAHRGWHRRKLREEGSWTINSRSRWFRCPTWTAPKASTRGWGGGWTLTSPPARTSVSCS